jgi:hypothetical protein
VRGDLPLLFLALPFSAFELWQLGAFALAGVEEGFVTWQA